MPPFNPQGPATSPASLPPVQAAPPQPTPFQPAGPVPAQAGFQQPANDAMAQAKQLVEQYRGNPYQLSQALQQLKIQYLAEQFHIITNTDPK